MHHDPIGIDVVLSPHPDDAVLSTWSVLTGDRPAVVVNVCTAVPPTGTRGSFDAVFGVDDSAELMRTRLAEDEHALAMVGAAPRNLGFLDHQYRGSDLSPDEVTSAIEEIDVGAAALFAPAGIGGHADHLAVRAAALELATGLPIPLRLYAELPYAVRAGWPSWVTGRSARPHLVPEARWEAGLDSLPVPPGALRPCPIALSADEVEGKLRALRTYRTQFEVLNGGPIGLLTNAEVINFELHWEVALTG
jgi:LmbE family N-acetylglucosaminyl deacetylase